MRSQGYSAPDQLRRAAVVVSEEKKDEEQAERREIRWLECDACGGPLRTLGHCKYLCERCGFMRTCMDTV